MWGFSLTQDKSFNKVSTIFNVTQIVNCRASITSSERRMQIYMDIGVSFGRFEYPAALIKALTEIQKHRLHFPKPFFFGQNKPFSITKK